MQVDRSFVFIIRSCWLSLFSPLIDSHKLHFSILLYLLGYLEKQTLFQSSSAVAILNSSLYSEVKNVRQTLEGLTLAVPHYMLTIAPSGVITDVNRKEQGPDSSSSSLSTLSTSSTSSSISPTLRALLGGRDLHLSVDTYTDFWVEEVFSSFS